MNSILITLLVVALISLWLVAAWLDQKHQWRFIDWFNGQANNPFKPSEKARYESEIIQKDQEIKDLKERVQVLEKIVTEPAYELNKKINSL